MAVEAQHLNPFAPQINREMVNAVELNNIYNSNAQLGMGFRGNFNFPSSPADSSTLLPTYSCVMADSKTPAIKSESGLSYNHLPNPATRKRSRDSMIYPLINYQNPSQIKNSTASPFSFLGQDFSLQIHQQQLDIDNLVSQHMEKVRMELEERRKKQARRMIETIEEGIKKKLRAKEDEIVKIGKMNWALEEKLKTLCIENQIWRDLAQTSEATANALRTNLEQLLAAQVKDERTHGAGLEAADIDDAQSCCGSSGGVDAAAEGNYGGRMCRSCGKEESCVLLLPCRHLCLCNVCGSSASICPICKASKNASFHINLS